MLSTKILKQEKLSTRRKKYDPKFLNQKGIRSLVDEDARVGRKSHTQDFFGYKTEFVMTTDERISGQLMQSFLGMQERSLEILSAKLLRKLLVFLVHQ